MKKDVELYRILAKVEPPRGLYAAVLARVHEAQQRGARIRVALFGALSVLSGVALVPAVQYAVQQFYASGFYDYSSLLLSDRALVVTYWREFAFSLIESLPAMALLLLVPLAVALVWSLWRVAQTAPAAFSAMHLNA